MLLNPHRFGSGGQSWNAVLSWVHANPSTGWTGYTFRVRVAKSLLTTHGTEARITISTGPSPGSNLEVCHIGFGSESGDAFDFDSTPTQVKFGGANGFSIAASTDFLSDPIALVVDGTRDIVLAGYASAGGSFAGKALFSGWSTYFKLNSDTATVNAFGYAPAAGGIGEGAHAMTKIEVR